VQAHRVRDAHFEHAADHHAEAVRVRDLRGLEGSGRPAELRVTDVDDGGTALSRDHRGVRDGTHRLVRGNVDRESRSGVALEPRSARRQGLLEELEADFLDRTSRAGPAPERRSRKSSRGRGRRSRR
jgi:hypothetical protein